MTSCPGKPRSFRTPKTSGSMHLGKVQLAECSLVDEVSIDSPLEQLFAHLDGEGASLEWQLECLWHAIDDIERLTRHLRRWKN